MFHLNRSSVIYIHSLYIVFINAYCTIFVFMYFNFHYIDAKTKIHWRLRSYLHCQLFLMCTIHQFALTINHNTWKSILLVIVCKVYIFFSMFYLVTIILLTETYFLLHAPTPLRSCCTINMTMINHVYKTFYQNIVTCI